MCTEREETEGQKKCTRKMSVRYPAAIPDPGDTKACCVKHENQMNNKIMK